MKKSYKTPECVIYALPTTQLCQTSMKINSTDVVTTSNRDNIGWSKGFSGGVEDDTPSGGLWDEE